MKLLIHSQTSTVAPSKFENGYEIISNFMLYVITGLNLIHVSKRSFRCQVTLDCMRQQTIGSHGTEYIGERGPCPPWDSISTTSANSVSMNDRKCKYIFAIFKIQSTLNFESNYMSVSVFLIAGNYAACPIACSG